MLMLTRYMQGLNCGMSAEDCASYYSCQFPAMIADWRTSLAAAWVRASLPAPPP